MKTLKYVLYGQGALVLLLLIGVAVVAATFDPNEYKPQIVKLVKDKTGRDLTIEGDIGLKFFPKLGAQIGRTRLSERSGNKEFAGVERVQVFVALLPLLSKQVVVDEVRLDGLRANLVKFKDGTTNFSDLTQGGKDKAEAPSEPPPAPADSEKKPVKIDIAGIQITNSHVRWRDETNGNDLALDVKQFETGRLADKTPSRIKVDMAIKGVQPKANLQTNLTSTLTFDLGGQLYSLKGLDAKLVGDALDYSGIVATVQGDVEANGATQHTNIAGLAVAAKANRGSEAFDIKLNAPRLQASPQTIAVESLAAAATGTIAGLTLTQSNLKAPKLEVNLGANQVLIDGLVLTALGKTGTDNLDISLSAPKLQISNEKAGGEQVTLIAKLAGVDRRADVTVKLSGVEGSAKALKVAAFALDLDAKLKDDAIKGTLTTPIAGNLETKLFELPKIDARFNVSSPSIPQKTVNVPLNGWVRADLGRQHISADLVSRFDESNIKAKLALAQTTPPAYDFDVAIDKLNVDRYLPPKKTSGAGAGKPGKPQEPKPQEPEKPIDLSALKPLNLNGKLQVGQLQVNNIKAANVRVGMRAKGGQLDVDPLAANLYQGTAAGSIGVNANNNHFVIKQKLTGIAIGPLLRDAADKDILEGKGNVALDVTTTGNLVSAMKRQLNGTARMELRDGAIKGIDLAGAVRTVKAQFGAKDAEGSGSQAQKTDFSELTATFVIKNGVAHNDDLMLKSPFIRVTGAGNVDVGADSVDYVVNTSVVGTTTGQGGKELGELKGFTIPVRVAGPYTGLTYKVEFSQMIGSASKEALKEAGAQALKEATKGKLDKDQLKALGKSLLGGGGAAKSGTQSEPGGHPGASAEPSKKPEDQLKDKLKGLLR